MFNELFGSSDSTMVRPTDYHAEWPEQNKMHAINA